MFEDCQEWPGARTTNGYGKRTVRGKTTTAHRAAWEEANGPIPDGLFVLHRCDNRPCCNLDHLFLGTHADNMQDMAQKGRGVTHRGVLNANCPLTASQIAQARDLYASGLLQREVAARLEVSQGSISRIVRGVTHSDGFTCRPASIACSYCNRPIAAKPATRRYCDQRCLRRARTEKETQARRSRGFKHGVSGYTRKGCRCVICCEAAAGQLAEQKRRKAECKQARWSLRTLVDGRLVAPVPLERHGLPSTYSNDGCRCEPCTAAHSGRDCVRKAEAAGIPVVLHEGAAA